MLKENRFKYFIFLYSIIAVKGYPKDLYFDPALVSGNREISDTMMMEDKNNKYIFDILINGKYKNTLTLANKNKAIEDYIPCFSAKDIELLELSGSKKLSNDKCYSIDEVHNGASSETDYQKLSINLLIPQAYLKDTQYYNDFHSWNDGENAVMVSYNYSGSSRESNHSRSTTDYLNVTSGVNISSWRYRNEGYYSRNDNNYSRFSTWKTLRNYISRPVREIGGELNIGDTTTNSSVFDSFSFRGVNISSDERMLPDKISGYAPVVKGNANSASHIEIKQRDIIIYDIYVPAGPYTIDDLRPMYTNGDLEVIVTDAAGVVTRYIEPYSTLPVMKRQGNLVYNISSGELLNNGFSNPFFIQSDLLYGFEQFTGYTGITYSEKYNSQLIGAGLNISNFGAISLDVTNSNSRIANNMSWVNGQSLRGLYSHTLNTTGTTIQLAGYKYSSSGFYTFQESVNSNKSSLIDSNDVYFNSYQSGRSKEQLQLSMSQNLFSLANAYLSGSKKNYWDSNRVEKSVISGVSGNVSALNYNISYRYSNMNYKDKPDRTISLSLWFPLNISGNASDSSPIWLHLNSTNTDGYGSSNQVALSGRALDDDRLDWNLTGDKTKGGIAGGSVAASYTGNFGKYNAGYSYNSSANQVNYGTSGGIIATYNGLYYGHKLGETNIIVSAPGANDISLENHSGIKTDWQGHAIITNANIYRRNKIILKTEDLADDVEISDPIQNIVPTRKSITLAKFNVLVGRKGLLKLMFNDHVLPLGTIVSSDNSIGIVDDQGVVYLTGLKENGVLKARWGEGDAKQCTASYNFHLKKFDSHIIRKQLFCQESL